MLLGIISTHPDNSGPCRLELGQVLLETPGFQGASAGEVPWIEIKNNPGPPLGAKIEMDGISLTARSRTHAIKTEVRRGLTEIRQNPTQSPSPGWAEAQDGDRQDQSLKSSIKQLASAHRS
jgi:hypothetical protein